MDAIAAGGRFNRSGYNALESAQRANFYEAMLWYAKEKNIADQQTLLAKLNEN